MKPATRPRVPAAYLDPWRREAERLERLSDWLLVALCLGIPVALVVGAVLGHFTWGVAVTAHPPAPRNPDVAAWLLECCTCGVWIGVATVREAVAWLQVHTHPDDRKATA